MVRVGRGSSARLGAVGALALGALLVAPAAYAAPDAPTPDRPDDRVDYYSNAFITGSKQVGTVIELELEDGSTPPCDSGGDLVFSSWQCGIDASHFWPRADDAPDVVTVEVYSRDPQTAERSPAATVRLQLGESRFEITTPPTLPSGDVVLLEGAREYGARVEWVIDGPSGPVFGGARTCEVPQDPESQSFSCVYDSREGSSRSSRLAARAPDGSYTATFTEFQGVQQIDQITYAFTVGTPPVPPAPPDPADPDPADPDPGDPADPTGPTDPTDGPGGGADDPDPVAPVTGTPTPSFDPSDPTDPPTPGADPGQDPSESDSVTLTVVDSPAEDVVATAAAPARDILPWLILAVLVFTVMGTLGMPGLALGGRFAPGSTRTGGGSGPVGRWPASDARGGTVAQRAGSGGLAGLAAGEVGGADEAVEAVDGTGESWGDRSPTWRAPGHRALDALASTLPTRLAPRWPLASRLLEDGTPVRAVLGSLSLALPVVGLLLGVTAARSSDGLPLAPAFGLAAVLLALGLLDALAGLAAVTGFTAYVVASGGLAAGDLTVGQGLRGLAGVAALWFVVPLIAGAARPFRRIRAAGQVYAWDRAADTVIAALLCGWAVQGLVGSLGELVGREQALTAHADALGLLTIALVAARFGLEEVATAGYPARLRAVAPAASTVEPSLVTQARGVAVRTGFLAFFAWAFLGSCWQLWAGVAIFALPYVLGLVQELIPDLRPVALSAPRGVTEVLVLVVVGALLAYWIDGSSQEDSLTALRNGFVILAVPASAIGVLGVLGGEAPAQRWTWPRQLAGAAIVAATVLVVLVWL